jgi:hypothetical protein
MLDLQVDYMGGLLGSLAYVTVARLAGRHGVTARNGKQPVTS